MERIETSNQEEWENEDINYWKGVFRQIIEFRLSDINMIYDFAEKILEKYNNAKEYAMFHMIIGSSRYKTPGLCSKFDFEDEDSVRKFLCKLKNSTTGG